MLDCSSYHKVKYTCSSFVLLCMLYCKICVCVWCGCGVRCWSCASSPLPLWNWCWTATAWCQTARTGYRKSQMNYWRYFVSTFCASFLDFCFNANTHFFPYPQEHKGFFDSVCRMSGQPRMLQHLCRCSLRLSMGARCHSAIDKLNIPCALKEYLLLPIKGEIQWYYVDRKTQTKTWTRM